jgi:hypothetical protein
MARQRRSVRRRISDARLRKALAQLKPPNDVMVLDAQTARVSRRLDATLKRGKYTRRAIQGLLAELGSSTPPVMHTRGGGFSSWISLRDTTSLVQIFNGEYLPTDDPSFWVPASRRYFDNEISTGAVGSASAYKTTGRLTTIQSVDLNASDESTWAAVYIMFSTDLANYGQVSRVTFEPEIDWNFHDYLDSNPVWLDRVAHLDGTIHFNANVWLTAYEFNIVTGKFDPIPPPSAKIFPVWQSTWYVSSLGASAMSGSLRNGAATFQFIVSPARTYALGASIQLRAWHTLKNTGGGPIPPPQSGDFTAYALFKAEVPEMWLQHQVLAR